MSDRPTSSLVTKADACEGLRLSAAEYLAIGETWTRCELIDGVTVVCPRPSPGHQKLLAAIAHAIDISAPGVDTYLSTDVVLSDRLVLCPDVSVYRPDRVAREAASLDTPPDLIVEVLSAENHRKDLVTKRQAYERHGVREYWIVEPQGVTVTTLRRQGDRFVEANAPDILESTAVIGVRVDLGSIRRSIR